MSKKISPKLQQAAEKYLLTLGSSRQYLTDKQWEIFLRHFKVERQLRWMTPFILLPFAIIMTFITFIAFRRANQTISSLVPDEVVYVRKANEETPVAIKPDQIKAYLNYIQKGAWLSGAGLANSTLLFTVIVLSIILKGHRRKCIEALVDRKDRYETPSGSSG